MNKVIRRFVFFLNHDCVTGQSLPQIPPEDLGEHNRIFAFNPADMPGNTSPSAVQDFVKLFESHYSGDLAAIRRTPADQAKQTSVLITMNGYEPHEREALVTRAVVVLKAFYDEIFERAAVDFWLHSGTKDFESQSGFLEREMQRSAAQTGINATKFTPVIQYTPDDTVFEKIRAWLMFSTVESREIAEQRRLYHLSVAHWLTQQIVRHLPAERHMDKAQKDYETAADGGLDLAARLESDFRSVAEECETSDIPFIVFIDDNQTSPTGGHVDTLESRANILKQLFMDCLQSETRSGNGGAAENQPISIEWQKRFFMITPQQLYNATSLRSKISDIARNNIWRESEEQTLKPNVIEDDLDVLIWITGFQFVNETADRDAFELFDFGSIKEFVDGFRGLSYVYIGSTSWQMLQLGTATGVFGGLQDNVQSRVGPDLFEKTKTVPNETGLMHKGAIWGDYQDIRRQYDDGEKSIESSSGMPTYLPLLELIVDRLEHYPRQMLKWAEKALLRTFVAVEEGEEDNAHDPYDREKCPVFQTSKKEKRDDDGVPMCCRRCLTAHLGNSSEFSFHYERIRRRKFWKRVTSNYWRREVKKATGDPVLEFLRSEKIDLEDVDRILDWLSSVIIDLVDSNRISAKSKAYLQLIVNTLEKYVDGKRVYPCPMLMEAMIKW
ncbi:MAG: hypothetical protein P9L99_11155 [Candidatus Lernaella stagnicola]|nr:hypothetical protein [Candidatus Lernaella stagnicola]